MAVVFVPAHVNEGTEPVDNLGGVLSVLMIGALVIGINFAAVPGSKTLLIGMGAIVLAAGGAFLLRQRRAANPLYDLDVAARRIFWVAALAGIIVFGSLMGAMFIGQQFLQNVLGYSTLEAGTSIIPAALMMVLIAPRSAKLVESHGARFTLLVGYVFVFLGFLTMLLLWKEDSAYWQVALAYALVGAGVGFAGTPASHSLTGAVPVRRVGMASGTADLQRDLGGAVMQSIFGALLVAGYASSFTSAIDDSSDASKVSDSTEAALTKSFDSAAAVAQQNPQYASQITAAAKESFLSGDHWAYTRRDRRGAARRAPGGHDVPAQGARAGAARGVPRGGRRRRRFSRSELRRRAVGREHAKRLGDLQGPDAEGPRRRAGAPLRLSTTFVGVVVLCRRSFFRARWLCHGSYRDGPRSGKEDGPVVRGVEAEPVAEELHGGTARRPVGRDPDGNVVDPDGATVLLPLEPVGRQVLEGTLSTDQCGELGLGRDGPSGNTVDDDGVGSEQGRDRQFRSSRSTPSRSTGCTAKVQTRARPHESGRGVRDYVVREVARPRPVPTGSSGPASSAPGSRTSPRRRCSAAKVVPLSVQLRWLTSASMLNAWTARLW